jgi:enoyl-CoA hydratase/carnithine racemase
MLLTGRRVRGEQAHAMGLLDRLVAPDELDGAAMALAVEIAGSAPLASVAIRNTMREELVERFRAAIAVEAAKQHALAASADFAEGVLAMGERREPQFTGS